MPMLPAYRRAAAACNGQPVNDMQVLCSSSCVSAAAAAGQPLACIPLHLSTCKKACP